MIGVGSIGERHLRCFQQTGRAELSFVEVNAELRATIASRYSISRAYDSLDAALQDSHDAAVICTPAPLHIPQARRIVAAGLHALIEKPLSVSLDGMAELVAEIKSKGIVAGVAYVLRCHPLIRSMRAALHSGRWGRPLEIIAVTGQHFPTYRPAYRQIYYASRATGGGAIQDALTHVVNAGEWLAGPMDRVVVDADHLALEGVEVEDTVHLLARHGGTLGSYSLNQHQAPNEFTLTVVAERGTARCELHANRWRWLEAPGGEWHDETLEPLERDTLFVDQANRFLDALDGGPAVPCSLEEAWQTLRVNLAALRSVELRSWQSVR